MSKKNKLIPELRFPEFKNEGEWAEEKLGKVFSIFQGYAFSSEDNVPSGTRWLKIADVGIQKMEDDNPTFLPANFKDQYEKFLVKKGDYVLALTRPILNMELKIAPVNETFHNALLNQRVGKILTSNYDTFVYYLLQNPSMVEIINKNIAGNEPPNLSFQQIESSDIHIPREIKEQKKIADCLSSLDEVIEAHTQKLDLLKVHKKGLMQNLFPKEGEKVPEYRFREFKKDGAWIKETVGDVYDFKVTNSFAREYLNYENGTVKNIHYGDIHTKFNTLFDITKEDVPYINPDVSIEKIRKDCYCIVGDMVFADASEDMNDVGKSIEIVNLNKEKLISGLHTLLARQKEKKLAIGFGGFLFKSDWVRKQIQREAQGAKVLGISVTRISNVQISYPKNHKEQEAISHCLLSLDEIVKAQEVKIKQLKRYKIGLIQGLFPKMIE